MVVDYYSEAFDKEHRYGEDVDMSPQTTLFIPVSGNLRAKIKG